MPVLRCARTVAVGAVVALAATPVLAQDANSRCQGCGESARPGLMQRCKARWEYYWKPLHQECWWGYPEEFEEAPFGSAVEAHIRVQLDNAEAARMTLYQYDFVDGTDLLKPRGKDQLAKIAALASRNFFPIVIENSAEVDEVDEQARRFNEQARQLDEQRRQTVLRELRQNGCPIADERVVIGAPISRGLNGRDAVRIEQNLNRNTKQKGLILQGSGGTSQGGMGGAGGGMSGGGGSSGGGF
jgi:hypothetical protein